MDDLISRAALKDELEHIWLGVKYSCSTGYEIGMERAMRVVADAPAVAAEPVRHARWEYRNNSKTCERIGGFEEWLVCSACDMEVECEYPNCPYCTARMDAKEDAHG